MVTGSWCPFLRFRVILYTTYPLKRVHGLSPPWGVIDFHFSVLLYCLCTENGEVTRPLYWFPQARSLCSLTGLHIPGWMYINHGQEYTLIKIQRYTCTRARLKTILPLGFLNVITKYLIVGQLVRRH